MIPRSVKQLFDGLTIADRYLLKPIRFNEMDEDEPHPLTYDTAKINFSTLKNLKQFIGIHKPLIENSEATIEHDAVVNKNPIA